MTTFEPQTLLRTMFAAAIAAAQPDRCLPRFLPQRPKGRTVVIGAGKASAAMARSLEQHWDGPLSGLVVTRYGHSVPCERIEIIEAAHPVPDDNSHMAAERMLQTVAGLTADDLVIALISGGGSALLALPAPGLTFADKQAINRALLMSGAPIGEMNCVRKHLSAIKGGRLAAAAAPASVVTLALSDVPGDDLNVIASGPTVADPTTFAEARAILARYGISEPVAAVRHLAAAIEETPKPSDKRLARNQAHVIASPQLSLEAAALVAREHGIASLILGDALEGEARDMGFTMAGIAAQVRRHGQPMASPCVLLSGGETTVTVRGNGRGGRNVEFLLALALKLQGMEQVYALAGDTDGIDGAEEVAGALIEPDSLLRVRSMGLDPWAELAANNAHHVFEKLGAQVVTGPTLTNVNDFRAILVL